MKILLSKIVLCSFPLMVFAAEAFARAGGGGAGSGKGGGIFSLILAPFFMLYYLYRKARIKLKNADVSAALKEMYIRENQWSEENLLSVAIDSFKKAQLAWSIQDLKAIHELLHPLLYPSWESDIKGQIARNERNEITGLSVEKILIIDVQNYKNDERDNFTVYIKASCKDKTIVDQQIISEKADQFEELWTFEWEKGKWVLIEVTQIGGWTRFVNRKIINEAISYRRNRRAA